RPPPYPTPFPYTTLFRSKPIFGVRPQRLFQGLVKVGDQVLGVFQTYGQAQHAIADAAFEAFFVAQAVVAGCARLADQAFYAAQRSEEHTSELQSRENLVC